MERNLCRRPQEVRGDGCQGQGALREGEEGGHLFRSRSEKRRRQKKKVNC
jgi:hypothetical protein